MILGHHGGGGLYRLVGFVSWPMAAIRFKGDKLLRCKHVDHLHDRWACNKGCCIAVTLESMHNTPNEWCAVGWVRFSWRYALAPTGAVLQRAASGWVPDVVCLCASTMLHSFAACLHATATPLQSAPIVPSVCLSVLCHHLT